MDDVMSTRTDRRRSRRNLLLGGSLAAAATAGLRPGRAEARDLDAERRRKHKKGWYLAGNNAKPGGFLGTKNAMPLVLVTAGAERMRITETGSVGVGTGSPSARLDVTGAAGVVVRGAAGPAATDVGIEGTAVAGTGVRGTSANDPAAAPAATGVLGTGTVGVKGTGQSMGVQGTSAGIGVFGATAPETAGTGVLGRGGTGVHGHSGTGFGVLGETDIGVGVKGESYSDGGAVKAVYGRCFGANGNGVVGEASNGTSAYGVWGISTAGFAGVFSGKVLVSGTLSKGGGSFQIDHPLDPTNKYLFHSFVESPDMMNVYNGNVTTGADGTVEVELPDYFEALNRDFRYQLTVIGDFAQATVKSKIAGGRFVVATDKPHVEVSWQVTGVRQDPWANANRIPVSADKPEEARGSYLHPEVYGEPAARGELADRLASLTTAP